MQIVITQQPDDGKFTVGQVYEVSSVHKMFVYAIDDEGSTEVVYNYQFTIL